MRLRLRYLIPCVIMVALPACAQEAIAPQADRSLPAALEAIQKARVRTRVLFITAHPDDESSSLLTYLSRGLGADVALLTLTRGEGGQNSVGPEQGPAMGMLRTEELYEATQIYGAKLFFTRAPDFGYSKSAEESLKIWDGQVLGDIVRVIRTFRPDVVINGWGGVHGGHGQHQASGILVPQAFDAAADAKQFPEQLNESLRPWRAKVLAEFWRGDGAPPESAWRIPADEVSPIWGKSYIDIGREGVLRHRSQSLSAFIDSPFFRRSLYLHSVKGEKLDSAMFAQPITTLGGETDSVRQLLAQADQSLERARQAELGLRWAEAIRDLADAGMAVSKARSLAADLDWELNRVSLSVNRALLLALAVKIEARADRAELVAGEEFSVRVNVFSRTASDASFDAAKLELPDGWTITKSVADQPGGIQITVAVPRDATPPAQPDAWMYPWPAALVKAQVHFRVGGYEFNAEEPAIARHATSTSVEDLPLELVPAVTLNVEPKQIVMRSLGPRKSIELQARVRYYGTKPAKISLGLDVPPGWTASVPDAFEFSTGGDRLVKFSVKPPERPTEGAFALRPYASLEGKRFETSRETLPSLPTRAWSSPAEAFAHVLDLVVPEHLRVGYIAADVDPTPEYLRQLGIDVEMLDEAALAFGDLKQFDAIVVGIRAYELRDDVVRANSRLLEYAAGGGTLLVQYQRDFAWNRLKPAPYPAEMQPAERITDENSPVRFVDPANPLLNFPNKITDADFRGWVQERGLYFWNKFDSHYQSALAMRDPGEPEALGGLVEVQYGKGTYIYTGLAFFRQLPAGVPGAYRLFVNLLCPSRAPHSRD